MEKVLKLYTYLDGVNDIPFPSLDNQIEVYTFRCDYKRMGAAPSITCNVMFHDCLDNLWTDNVYAEFNGEKFFLKQTPTSSYDNTDSRYKHELELVSERIILDNVYFYDVVDSDEPTDKPVSNSSKFTFFGTINEFAQRLNQSLAYSKVGYRVVVDDGISSEGRLISFENQFFSNALQEAYNTYEIPYYFVGKEIHIGFTDNAITHTFKYGVDESLLSIQKQNANNKIVNRITGVGSTDNIPYYYPNDYESKAEVEANGGVWVNPQTNLMPPIYRESNGSERFYNALNDTYISPQTGTYYSFENQYIDGKPKEHIVNFENIKPSIVGMTNALGYRIDMFKEFAYDLNDNDETDDEGNYLHPYFFGKLKKFDGEFGFNLFDHAIDENEMVISMTSGSCGSCEFVIGVNDDQKNTVQVDNDGYLIRDNDGNIQFGNPQDKQNDTRNNEVWIALRKDINTFGVIMPNATHSYKPSTNDTFVILHIDLPKSYILSAENKLKDELIKYMAMNNSEKFNFSITFSRIFFAEHPEILKQLNENSLIQIEYNDERYELYISSFTYSMSNDKPLPEIKVELKDTITIQQNALQHAISDVKQDIMSSIGNADYLKQGLKYFLRKDRDDIAHGHIKFEKGLKSIGTTETDDVIINQSIRSKEFISGFTGGKGWAIRMKEYLNSAGVLENRSEAEVDDLIVRGTMRVYEFIVSQLLGENDNRIFTAMLEVDHYDKSTGMVWLDTQGGKLYNPFRVDDIILVQQYGGMPSEENDYYITKQYELVVSEIGVGDLSLGEDRLDWVKFRNFSSPMEGATEELITKGDTFVRIDNLSNPDRKGIIEMMTVGADTPYMDVVYGKKTDPDNALKARFGNLQGIYSPLFGWLKDFGSYITNLYAVGEFRIAHTGEDVSDAIEMTKGAFRTNFKQVMYDMTEDDNLLSNGVFAGDLSMWQLGESTTNFLAVDGTPVIANRSMLTAEESFCGIDEYMGRNLMRIYDSKVTQLNSYIERPDTHKEYEEGEDGEMIEKEVPDKVYLTLNYYCRKDGDLWVGFTDGNGNPHNSTFPNTSVHIESGIERKSVTCEGEWDGTGNFTISTTGDIYVDMVVLTTKPLEDFKAEYSTRIEQDARRIALIAEKTTETESKVAQLEITAEEIKQSVVSANGTAEDAEKLAEAAEKAARTATFTGIYGREEYNQTTNPWNEWENGTEHKHVGAIWYNPDTDTTSRYIGTDNTNSWETVPNSLYNSATYVFQNEDRWSAIAGKFDENGNPLSTSGFVTEENFAGVFSSKVDGNYKTSAEIITYVDDTVEGAISNIRLTADKITIYGETTINDIFKVTNGIITLGGFTVNNDSLTSTTTFLGSTMNMELSAENINFMYSDGLGAGVAMEAVFGPTSSYFSNEGTITAGVKISNTAGKSSQQAGLLLNVNSGYNIYASGGSCFLLPSAGNLTRIQGLSLYGIRNTSGTLNSITDFILASGNVTLPAASTLPGKIIFVKMSGNYSVSSTSTIVKSSGSDTYTSESFNNRALFYISNGSRWYEFTCYSR